MTPKMPISTPHPAPSTPTARRAWLAAAVGLALLHGAVQAADTSPAQQLERFSAQAASPGQAERGDGV